MGRPKGRNFQIRLSVIVNKAYMGLLDKAIARVGGGVSQSWAARSLIKIGGAYLHHIETGSVLFKRNELGEFVVVDLEKEGRQLVKGKEEAVS